MKDRPDLRWRRLSLSTRLNVITTSVLLITMTVFVALDYARERRALLDAEAERLATIGGSAARHLPQLLSALTAELLRAVASTAAERPVAVYVVRDGRFLLSSNPRTNATALFAPMKRVDSSGSYDLWWTSTGLAVSLPYPGKDAGAELFVETGLDSVEQVLSRTLRLHVLHGLATVLAMSLGVGWVLRRAVHRPFARMISAMNVMERGTWELDVPVSYQDEVGVLMNAFNRMGKKVTRTAREFARAERLAAIAFLSARIRRELDSPLAEIESASSRLQARALFNKHVEDEASRIHEAATVSRRSLERLDDFFLAQLRATIDSAPRASTEPATPDEVVAADEPAG